MKHKISISDNIRLIREGLGYSQDYVATRLDITQQTYSNLEKNPEKQTLKRLKEVASILQVNIVTLIGEDETYIQQNFNQQGGHAATQMNVSSNGEKEVYEKLIAEFKEQIEFLKSLLKK